MDAQASWVDMHVASAGGRSCDKRTPTQMALLWLRNAHFIRSDAEGLFFGSGGAYGLALDASLLHGTSGPSETYGNSPLPLVAAPPTSGSFNSPRVQQLPHDAAQNAAVVHFECAALEVWGVDESTCRTLPACEGHVHVHAHCAPCAPGDAQTDT